MYHSHIGLYLNTGLLTPVECITRAQTAYDERRAPLNAVEGVIRQILGWREYVRGIYWLKMPAYKTENALGASQPLPDFFWTGATQMNCLRHCVLETKQNAYAHHIQRLMVLGNFALIAGLDPDAVNEWYMLVYADAYEWVELPNVSDMVLFVDAELSDIVQMALSDHISFATIRTEYGIGEKDVQTLMRRVLKPGSYKAWRKRVRAFSGRRETYK